MRGRIVLWMEHDRAFVVRPENSTSCDILIPEQQMPPGCQEIEFDVVQSDRGFHAINLKCTDRSAGPSETD